MVEKKPVGRPPKVQPPFVPEGPCIICKRITRELAAFGDKQVFLHGYDCEGPTL